ncbi:hypothetical protein P7H79_05785 [Lactococcus lactis]|uniref:hypothetical protein n=1 Tax=Lactococcus lactis TaxID=1358 RepID=UPI00289181C2|nr:hypothetical protein [Lactococcus lactis]MDT2872879.1 hypothetical protein [Lactococcus lactis]MDT2934716.1 hypothetical protein [Lactococcus lactis]
MRIILNFDKTTSRLSGNPYGKEVYHSQVEDKYTDYSEPLVLVFPDHIKRVAFSFVQGFFTDLVSKIGFEGIANNITIEAGSQKVIDQIINRIE